MVKQIFTLIENKVPPSCGAAILFHCTIHYTILLARCSGSRPGFFISLMHFQKLQPSINDMAKNLDMANYTTLYLFDINKENV